MVAGSMTKDRYLDHIYPSVAHLPTTLPWRLAGWLGDKLPRQQATLKFWLASHFSRVFPLATFAQCHEWAGAHLRMLAEEKVDAMAFHRLGHNGGPTVDLQGAGLAQALAQRKHAMALLEGLLTGGSLDKNHPHPLLCVANGRGSATGVSVCHDCV